MRRTRAAGDESLPGRLGGSDCERLRPGPIAQPVNTVTSTAYVLGAGVALARRGRGSVSGGLATYSALMTLVGLGSIAFHGPQPPGARVLHDLPIPVLIAVAVGTPVLRRRRGEPALPGWTRSRGIALALLSMGAAAAYAGGRTDACTCDPDSPLQLHGAWHVLTATGFVVGADVLYPRGARE